MRLTRWNATGGMVERGTKDVEGMSLVGVGIFEMRRSIYLSIRTKMSSRTSL